MEINYRTATIDDLDFLEKSRLDFIHAHILDKLIQNAKAKDYHVFILQESDMGKPLYEKYGFCDGKQV